MVRQESQPPEQPPPHVLLICGLLQQQHAVFLTVSLSARAGSACQLLPAGSVSQANREFHSSIQAAAAIRIID